MSSRSLLKSVYHALASVRVTIFVLFSLCIASIVGTLFPQGTGIEELIERYGPRTAMVIKILELQDIYHSSWFQILLALLTVNLIACTSKRFPKTLKLLRHQETKFSPQKLNKYSHRQEISTSLPLDRAISKLETVLTQRFSSLRPLASKDPYMAVAERGRLSHWTVYIVHFSVIVILGGALVGSLFGFKGSMSLNEGEASNLLHSFRDARVIRLPFKVRCDRFKVSFYPNGMPKDYLSYITIIEDGKEVRKGIIKVNSPFTYRGVTFYQASYSSTVRDATILFTDLGTGKSYEISVPFRTLHPLQIPGRDDQVEILDYYDNLHGFGPALAIVLFRKGENPKGAWILVNYPGFHGNRINDYAIEVLKFTKSYSTGLQAKHDPGTWIVMSGFCMLLASLGITLYNPHRKLWIWAGSEGDCTKVIVAGRGSRDHIAFKKEFDALCKTLKKHIT